MKRTTMVLYSGTMDVYSHQVRIALAEKGVAVRIVMVDSNHPPKELAELNPYTTVPTLVDRELVLYESRVILEYLDERFPHPPLLPVYPVARAKSRLMMHRIEQDLYGMMHKIQTSRSPAKADAARVALRDNLVSLDPVFADMPYFLSDDFSLIDCYFAPMFWRLPSLNVSLPKTAKGLLAYIERLFMRDTFETSLSESERDLREEYEF